MTTLLWAAVLPPATTALFVVMALVLLFQINRPEFNRVRTLLVAGTLAVVMGFNYRVELGLADPPPIAGVTEPALGPATPEGWTLQTLDGETVRPAELRGKVLFVNYWATWCPPCVGEMPSLQKLHDHFAGDPDVRFLFVALDNPPRPAVPQFLQANGYDLPVCLPAGAEPAGDFAYQGGIPKTLVIGKDGRLRQQVLGATDWFRSDQVRFLEQLAGENVIDAVPSQPSADTSDPQENDA